MMMIILKDVVKSKLFRALTRNDILKLYISDPDFRGTNVNSAGEDDAGVGYSFYVFDIGYQKNL